jgi:hypothetical protein
LLEQTEHHDLQLKRLNIRSLLEGDGDACCLKIDDKNYIADISFLDSSHKLVDLDWSDDLKDGIEPFEAEELLKDMLDDLCLPVFTIPREHISEVMQNGLKPRPTWIPVSILAGTIGIHYYNNSGDRYIVVVKSPKKYNLKPRFTGPKQNFHGVVVCEKPIDADDLIIIDSTTNKVINTFFS